MTPKVGTFSGGGLGFGVAFTLQDQFSAVADRIQAKFTGLEGMVQDVANKIDESFDRVVKGAAMVWAGMELLSPIKSGLDVAAMFEVANVRLETLLHSTEEAKRVWESLKAEEPFMPFDLPTLLNANTALIGAGMAADKAKSAVDSVANAVAAVGGSTPEMMSAMMDLQKIYETGYADKRHLFQLSFGAHIPILQLLQNSTGKTKEELMTMKLTFEQIVDAMTKAANKGGMFENALDKMAHTWTGMLTTLHTRVLFAWAAIGDAILPVSKRILQVVINLLDKFEKFAQTAQGKVVVAIGIVALMFVALSVILVGVIMLFKALAGVISTIVVEILPFIAIGLLMVAVGYGIYRMLDSLNGVVVVFGLALASVVFGPLGVLAAGLFLLVKAWGAFTDVMNGGAKATGFLLFLQKLGGVLQAVWHIMQNANEAGFTLIGTMAEGLDRLGILDTVVGIGTWIVRIKMFSEGLWTGIKGVWTAFANVLEWIADVLKPVGYLLESFGVQIGNNTSALDKWVYLGKIAGIMIGTGMVIALISATASLISMTIATIAAFWPLFLIIGAVWLAIHAWQKWGVAGKILAGVIMATLVPVIITLIGVLWDMAVAVAAAIWPVTLVLAIVAAIIYVFYEFYRLIKAIIDQWDMFIYSIGLLGDAIADMFHVGVQLVENLWAGIRSRWDAMMDWITKKVNESPVLKFAVESMGNATHPLETVSGINDKFGMPSGNSGISTPASSGSVSTPAMSRYENLTTPAQQQVMPSWMTGTPNWWEGNAGSATTVVHVYVDSDEVAARVAHKSALDDKRD